MKKFNRFSAGVAAVATALMLSTVPAGASSLFSMSSGTSLGQTTNPGKSNSGGSNSGDSKLDNSNRTVNVDGVMLTPTESRLVSMLNDYRASKGLKALKVSSNLVNQSRSWSKVQASQKNMYHSKYNVWENVALNYSGAAPYVLNQWKNSPPHNRAMLESSIAYVGFGQAPDNEGGYYATLQMI